MTEATLERKYALIRIAAGDYLLLGNDGKTLWRIAKYIDGPSLGLDWPRDREFWGYWTWNQTLIPGGHVELDDWERWEQWGSGFKTRQAAIDAALVENT